MKSGAVDMGNINMKGKKYALLSCGCCQCVDFREKEAEKLAKKEMRNYFKSDIDIDPDT